MFRRLGRPVLWALTAAALAGTLALYRPESADPTERSDPAPAGRSAVLDLNRATVSQLEELPGIGPVLAQRIVDAAPYGGPEELLAVSGVGPALWEDIAPLVYFGE